MRDHGDVRGVRRWCFVLGDMQLADALCSGAGGKSSVATLLHK